MAVWAGRSLSCDTAMYGESAHAAGPFGLASYEVPRRACEIAAASSERHAGGRVEKRRRREAAFRRRLLFVLLLRIGGAHMVCVVAVLELEPKPTAVHVLEWALVVVQEGDLRTNRDQEASANRRVARVVAVRGNERREDL